MIRIKNICENKVLILAYSIQLIVVGLCFFIYATTIEIFPWYEPLTMGPFMAIMILTPIQGILSTIILFKKKGLNNNISFISLERIVK